MASFRWLIGGELLMGVIALVWAVRSDTAIPYALDGAVLRSALLWTAVLVAVNFSLYVAGRRASWTSAVYELFEREIFPLLRRASVPELLVLAAIAGFSEELLFRGMLQPRMGLVASGLLFGLLHGPDYKLWPFALWASAVGIGLGALYIETGNLAVPMIVHGLYDAVALLYIRFRAPGPSAGGEEPR